MATTAETLRRVYNRFVIDMAINLKRHSPALKRALKAHGYHAVDPEAEAHLQAAAATLPLQALLDAPPEALLADEAVLGFQVLKGLALRDFAADFAAADARAAAASLRSYVYILGVLCATHARCAGGEGGGEEGGAVLLRQVLAVLGRAQSAGATAAELEEADEAKAAILDDDVVALLSRVEEACAACDEAAEPAAQPAAGPPPVDEASLEDALRRMENSKIGGLAKEISGEIDVSKLPMDNPMEMFNFANLTDGNSMLGSIVSKVGAKIQTKLASGELKQEELLGEAMSLLKVFDGGAAGGGGGGGGAAGGLGDLLKMAAAAKQRGGGGAPRFDAGALRTQAARDRLRSKLDAKKGGGV